MSRSKYLALYVLFVFSCFFSCNEKKLVVVDRIEIPDSTMIDTAHYVIKKIHIGSNITNHPLSSQIITIAGKEKYLLLDEHHIYVFDWESGELNDSIPTDVCGKLDNYSGFTFVSRDSIAVFNSAQGKVYIIDMTGRLISEKKVPSDSGNPVRFVSSIEAMNACRINMQEAGVQLNGSMLGCLQLAKRMGISDIPVTEMLNAKGEEAKVLATYPKQYMESNWGIQYMNRVYTTYDNNGNTLYSFPIMNRVIRYNGDYSKCDTIRMQSRYDMGINPCNISQEDIEKDETQEIRYYISQLSYSNIIFDQYRNVYIRVVEHPLKRWSVKESFVKPKSFIVSDTSGKTLSETPIIANSRNMQTFNIHVCKYGLAIAMANHDENNIYFACLKIK